MSLKSDLRQYIVTEILPGSAGESFADSDPLVSSGRIDSMGLLQVVGFIQTRYGVDLLAGCEPKDLDSIDSLSAAIGRIKPSLAES
jgi:acyl carrier protein